MAYDYRTERAWTLTDEGQREMFRLHARARMLCGVGGYARLDELVRNVNAADAWKKLALVDRLVELGELIEFAPGIAGSQQDRCFYLPSQR